ENGSQRTNSRRSLTIADGVSCDTRVARDRASIAGRLIEHAVTIDRLGECGGIGVLGHLEGIEAGAMQEQELVAQNLAGRAQLAAKAMALAQQPGLAVCAAVAEVGKDER